MTTDADSTVFPDWVDANLDELHRVDLVCGTDIADPGEFARLPPAIARLGAVEAMASQLEARLGALETRKVKWCECMVHAPPAAPTTGDIWDRDGGGWFSCPQGKALVGMFKSPGCEGDISCLDLVECCSPCLE